MKQTRESYVDDTPRMVNLNATLAQLIAAMEEKGAKEAEMEGEMDAPFEGYTMHLRVTRNADFGEKGLRRQCGLDKKEVLEEERQKEFKSLKETLAAEKHQLQKMKKGRPS